MNYTLRVWRQKNSLDKGRFVDYEVGGVAPEMSILDTLDLLNERLLQKGEEPVAFESDCREGICGACGLFVNGYPHGPHQGTTTCEVRMRLFADGATIVIEPFRAKAFPVVKDLVVDRSSLDRVIAAGGFVSVNTGNAQDANSILVGKDRAAKAMDAAACIGCGACVAACPNAAAMLFAGAKVTQLALLAQGNPERERRALAMRERLDLEGFGNCSNEYECEAACPKKISVSHIARLNWEYLRAAALSEPEKVEVGPG